jgi:hypothetical protein
MAQVLLFLKVLYFVYKLVTAQPFTIYEILWLYLDEE